MEEKQKFLERLETKKLYDNLFESSERLRKLELDLLDYSSQNRNFLKQRGGSDCEEVKYKEADLLFSSPDFLPNGAKATLREKDAWLFKQRKDDETLKRLLQKQNEVEMEAGKRQAELEAEKRRYESMLGLLRLRVSQIEFLAGK